MIFSRSLVTLFALGATFASIGAQEVVFDDPMPGSVQTKKQNRTRGFAALPEWSVRGADTYLGWTSGNRFVRSFYITYDHLHVRGEFKHGLWRWLVDDKATLPLWWCVLGGSFEGSDGLADVPPGQLSNPQSNMRAVWDAIDRADTANRLGPLAKAAGLDRVATTAIRVHMGTDRDLLWKNRGTAEQPFQTPVTASEGSFEVYIIRAPYHPVTYMNTTKCAPHTHIRDRVVTPCGNEQTILIVVPSASVSDPYTTVNFESAGFAFGRGRGCPLCNGKSCVCDALTIDINFNAYLFDREPLTLFVPHYARMSDDAVRGYKMAEKYAEKRDKGGM